MIKLIFLILCLVAGASAVVPWSKNPSLPGYPVFFGSWGSWPHYCDTLYKSEKQCFNDCMDANGMGRFIDQANSITNACPPTLPRCKIPWRRASCQCAKRCKCKLPRCGNAKCLFCRK